MVRVVYVEGVVGTGKTTMAPRLAEHLTTHGFAARYVTEPVDEWKRSGMLERFYADMTANAFDFHMYVLESMFTNLLCQIEASHPDTVLVCERSIYSVKHVFVKNLLMQGLLTLDEYDRFNERFSDIEQSLPEPSLFVWLDTPLSTCMERVRHRNRLNESTGVSHDYQLELWKAHNDFFQSTQHRYVVSPQISFDYREEPIGKSHEANFFKHIFSLLEVK